MARIPNEETNPEEDTFEPKSRKVFAAMPNWIRSGTKGDGAWNSFQQGPGMKITRNSVFGLCSQLLPQRHWESNKLTSGFGRLTARIHAFNTFFDRVTLNKIDLKFPRALVSAIQIDWNFCFDERNALQILDFSCYFVCSVLDALQLNVRWELWSFTDLFGSNTIQFERIDHKKGRENGKPWELQELICLHVIGYVKRYNRWNW